MPTDPINYSPLSDGGNTVIILTWREWFMKMYEATKLIFSPLTIALIILIFSRSIDRVMYQRMTVVYIEYMWYLANVILPIAFLVISWPVVWYKMLRTKDITPEMRAFPMYKFAIMGALDTSYNLLSTFPQPYLGGDLCNVMSQVVLPFNMIGSILFLGTRYKQSHWVGAVLVIYGVLVSLMPTINCFLSHENCPSADSHLQITFFWIMINTLSMVFAAASNIYKEAALKDYDLDVWYTNSWVGVFQLGAGFLTTWTISIQAFQDPPISFSQLPTYIEEANNCFLGYNVTAYNSTSHSYYDKCGDVKKDQIGIFGLFCIFIIFNITYNMLMLYTFKSGSSVLFVISSAVALPLSQIMYTSPFLAGPATEAFTIYDGYALFALVLSIIVYYSEKEERIIKDELTGRAQKVPQTPMFATPAAERAHERHHHNNPKDPFASGKYGKTTSGLKQRLAVTDEGVSYGGSKGISGLLDP